MTRTPHEATRHSQHRNEIFRMFEFEEIAESRPVDEILRGNLQDAEMQLRVERARARRAQQRADELARAVENWHELLEDYERVTSADAEHRRN